MSTTKRRSVKRARPQKGPQKGGNKTIQNDQDWLNEQYAQKVRYINVINNI